MTSGHLGNYTSLTDVTSIPAIRKLTGRNLTGGCLARLVSIRPSEFKAGYLEPTKQPTKNNCGVFCGVKVQFCKNTINIKTLKRILAEREGFPLRHFTN